MTTLKKILHILNRQDPLQGFTLMEIIIVVITLGVITSLALSNYNKVMEQAYCNNAQMNLIAIYNAGAIHNIRRKTPGVIHGGNITDINNTLNLNINDSKYDYTFWGLTPLNFSTLAIRKAGGPSITCQINYPDLLKSNNPKCDNKTYFNPVISP